MVGRGMQNREKRDKKVSKRMEEKVGGRDRIQRQKEGVQGVM